ncbi:Multicopper oxidase with three cupredoxin domains (includes cell division protein FtsP and spore coat protein CotA) [Micromonospora rhizosphaerae]|uniref:Multicopper oxidase with three cupredoxin domains (Includes cell division protein FtsP and spore coat protein CotA) n=1 Tax=Micromonospora rhizosphaerae TaxID=568872 RepID=A0A1C6SWR5_9ACTN|nr:multicopper oxidase family protein [Micromonospora rhizosphaerae]SCL33948.1 Multicopper oxidase with three cupredoxin domains (includes cell division protein FtsP and spore coat protein CotA) [Micromonospora rhizosphaerae]
MSLTISRRRLLAGIAGTVGLAGAAAWAGGVFDPRLVPPNGDLVARTEAARRRSGAATVTARLNPRPVTHDLGGPTVATWGYADSGPGPLIRARAGDLLRVEVTNDLPAPTSVHWHGIALRNDMDGVPGLTQRPIPAGGRHTYEFTVPDPGTYFYHPHSGVQLDRALYGVLVVDDPHETGRYDEEWIVVLDDWVDGTGRTPDDVLASLRSMGGHQDMAGMHHGGLPGMSMGGMEMMTSPLLGGAGDVAYPHYLINGRVPAAPVTLTARPGQRVRIRLVNAASDTAFRVALGGHRLTVTHTDGFPVVPVTTDALLLGMGERADVVVTLGDGSFPLVAAAEGKTGHALAVVRSGTAGPPNEARRPVELDRQVLTTGTLRAAERVALTDRRPDRVHRLFLGGAMMPYRWTINGTTFDHTDPLLVRRGERVRLEFVNTSTMFHPMHVHGHTFAVAGGGARKDTVIVTPRRTVAVDLDADNPGQWMTHCHNIYHAETGMMISLAYRT